MEKAELEKWLERKNEEYRRRDMPHRQRPWQALGDFSIEFRTAVSFESPEAKAIFAWFSENSKPGAHQIGYLFEAAYFFDGAFWEVNVPVFYSTVKIKLMELLVMPESIKQTLQSDVPELQEYAGCATDALDYGLGIDSILKDQTISALAKSLAVNASSYLRACAQTLRAHHPDRSVIQNARFAGEIALKSLLCARYNHDENSIKKFGHDLPKLLEEAIRQTKDDFLTELRSYVSIFPPMDDRYTGERTDPRLLWNCYRLALALNASFTRIVTGIDNRGQLLGKQV